MWSRRDRDGKLERALRRQRPTPPEALVREVSDSLSADSRPSYGVWSRLAFASAVAVLILGTFASLGGLSYARPGAVGTYQAVKQIVVAHKLKVTVHTTSAKGQYPHPPHKKPVFTPPKVHHTTGGVAAQSSGTLPFTGISLLGTLALSLALIGVGIMLRRRERRS